MLASALGRWVARLPRLQTMTLYEGAALAEGAQSSIHVHCPLFKALTIYEWFVHLGRFI